MSIIDTLTGHNDTVIIIEANDVELDDTFVELSKSFGTFQAPTLAGCSEGRLLWRHNKPHKNAAFLRT